LGMVYKCTHPNTSHTSAFVTFDTVMTTVLATSAAHTFVSPPPKTPRTPM
jgi:hypothetical protein